MATNVDLVPDSVMALFERLQQRRSSPCCANGSCCCGAEPGQMCGCSHGRHQVGLTPNKPVVAVGEACTTCRHPAQQHSFGMVGGVLVTRCPSCPGGVCGQT